MNQTTKISNSGKNKKNTKIMRKLGGKILWSFPSLWTRPTSKTGEVTLGDVFRAVTGKFRILPAFLIIGTQKGGTYSLYNYLLKHPSVHPAYTKEIRYFDRYYHRGENWYAANFPTILSKFLSKTKKTSFLTGEATHDYLFHNVVPKRVKKDLPNVKLVVTLRNPVDRAYSHYNNRKRSGQEKLSFEEAIKIHDSRIQKSWWHHQRFSYLKRGLYAEQLEYWFKYFPRKQFFIVETKEMETNFSQFYDELCAFLEIKKYPIDYKKYNIGKYNQMNPKTRQFLVEYFKPYNQKLYDLLGRKFDWDK